MSETNVIAFNPQKEIKEIDKIDSPIRFEEGQKVASIYFTGKIVDFAHSENNQMPLWVVKLTDEDKRADGKLTYIVSAELIPVTDESNDKPRFIQDYEYAQSVKGDTVAGRKRTTGELWVGLSTDGSGIDSMPAVYKIKSLCAQLIDEVVYNQRLAQKEISIASINPTDQLAANVAVADMYKDSIQNIVALKCDLVSAAVGNNNKC